MIINRIVNALRRQDWITVIIETLIVVLGVYLGVLLGNWNTERRDRALYDEAYNRMIVDLQDNVRMLEEISVGLEEPLRIAQRAIDDLRQCRTDEEAVKNVQAAFAPIGVTVRININTVSLDQFVSNETFLRFQPSSLRRQLLSLFHFLHSAQQNSEQVSNRQALATMELGLTQKGTLRYGDPGDVVSAILAGEPPSPELVRRRELKVSLGQACQDESFLNEFYSWEDNAYYQSVFSTMIATRLKVELETL